MLSHLLLKIFTVNIVKSYMLFHTEVPLLIGIFMVISNIFGSAGQQIRIPILDFRVQEDQPDV